MADVTSILTQLESGDQRAAEQLLPVVYDELRQLAAAKLAREKPGQTLQPTALVHEAYLRLVGDGNGKSWDSRGHFFAAAAEAMRRILVERARRHGRERHGGGLIRHDLESFDPAAPEAADELIALNDALVRLAAQDEQAASLVKMRYFAGLTLPQAAEALAISPRTADRLWTYARAFLYAEIYEN
jgi:RNA polymerase sigma factor (TIGR02999 family)